MDSMHPFDDDSETYLSQDKRLRLLGHIPFIEKIIASVKGTEFEEKWNNIHLEVITLLSRTSNDKMTIELIDNLDATINEMLSEQTGKTEYASKPTAKAPPRVQVPVPADLGQPALSTFDLQELIQDLSAGPPEVVKPPPVEIVKEILRAPSPVMPPPVRAQTRKCDPKKLPSSWCPSKKKTDVAKTKGPTIPRLSEISRKSLAKNFKIPQNKESESSTLPRTPPQLSPASASSVPDTKVKHEVPMKLHSIDIFKPAPDKILRKTVKKVEENNETREAISKIKIIRSPSSDKKHEFFSIKKAVEAVETSMMEEKRTPIIRVRSDEDLKSPLKKEPESKSEPMEDVESESQKVELRRNKELRRLHENIVKDGAPLTSRRSCTLKRNSSGLADAADVKENDDQDKAIVKRRKISLEKSSSFVDTTKRRQSVKAEETPIGKKRSASPPTAKRSAAKTKQEPAKPPVGRFTRNSLPISFSSKAREPVKKKPLEETKKSVEQVSKKLDELVTKKSEEPVTKKLRSNVESGSIQETTSANLPSPEATNTEPKKTPITSQCAKKSTNQRQEIFAKIRKLPAILGNAKATKKKQSMVKPAAKVVPTIDDGEWEDVDDDASIEEIPEVIAPHPVAPTPFNYKSICNIAFNEVRSGALFKCLVRDCKFQTLKKYTFIDHLERHSDIKWNGFCNICCKSVFAKGGNSLMKEFFHMVDIHIGKTMQDEALPAPVPQLIETAKPQITEPKAPQIIQPEQPQNVQPEPVASQDMSIPDFDPELMKGLDSILNEILPQHMLDEQFDSISNEKVFSPPKPAPLEKQQASQTATIQISKNFVGRRISLPLKFLKKPIILATKTPANQTVKPALPQVSTEKIVTYVIKKPESSSTTVPGISPTVEVIKEPIQEKTVHNSPVVFNEKLRPWLKVRLQKEVEPANQMLSQVALTATYKCLGSSCSFFTIVADNFRKHLNLHELFTVGDRDNFMSCAYCTFTAQTDRDELIDHINKEHGYDRFQCNYCFYRSCGDYNVLTHQSRYHKMRPRKILQLEQTVSGNRDHAQTLDIVKAKRHEFVPPIVCIFCRKSFFALKAFLTHVAEHKIAYNTRCSKCNERTSTGTLLKHLTSCHRIGLLQCVYCRFGTNTFEDISNHVANEHPSALPLFCERTESKFTSLGKGLGVKAQDVSSIDSTCLKHISQAVSPLALKPASTDIIALANYTNIRRLGSNIHIRGIDEPMQKPRIQAVKTESLMAPQMKTFNPPRLSPMQPPRHIVRKTLTKPILGLAKLSEPSFTSISTIRSGPINPLMMLSPPKLVPFRRVYEKQAKIMEPEAAPKPHGLKIQDVYSLSDKNIF